MKKKGLIISTVVMAVVLIASLTTATYAWFTTADSAEIGSVSFGVVSGADVLIGMQYANRYSAGLTSDNFVTGNLSWNAEAGGTDIDTDPRWDGGTRGLSANAVSFSGVMPANLTTAIGFGTPYDSGDEESGVATGTFDSENIVKANGRDTLLDKTSVISAEENIDYIHLVIGVKAGKEGIASISLKMTLTDTTTGKQTLGMMAATHYTYAINELASNDNNTEFTESSYSDDYVPEGLVKTIEIVNIEDGINVSNIYTLDLYVWIDGNDTDCNISSMGSQLQIAFEIVDTPVEEEP